jgi:hypothetical protein
MVRLHQMTPCRATAARSMKKRNYMGYFYIFRENMNRPASTRISAKISA